MKCHYFKNFEKEIIEFFKSKSIDVIIESLDFQSHTCKSEQCSISILNKEKVTEQRALGIRPISINTLLAHFELITMPGCCGIVISTGSRVNEKLRGLGIGQFLHSLRLKIAKEWGYGILLCTDIDYNAPQKHILKKNNWKQIDQFKNPRTNNIINIHTYHLK